MKKRYVLGLAIVLMVFGLAGGAGATLTEVGTATYNAALYKLIYDNDLQITWLDYTKTSAVWQDQMTWASGLGGLGASLTVSLLPGYATTNNWATGWRLPSTKDESYVFGYDGTTTAGYNITNSEMGHLYYTELENKGYYATDGNPQPGWGLTNKGPFNKLVASWYWSGTEYANGWNSAWNFYTDLGCQSVVTKDDSGCALAVRPGQVASVPVPGAMLLMGSGLVGLAGLRRRKRGR